jgi:MAF protein
MELGNWDFSVIAAPINENTLPGEMPKDYVHRLAESKAQRTLSLIGQPIEKDCLIVAADTAVVDENDRKTEWGRDHGTSHFEILGKPSNTAEAEKMLRQLRGKVHRVLTGLTVLRPYDSFSLGEICSTEVSMRTYSDEEIMTYIAGGDPLDKAGAYAIQHVVFRPVDVLNGCYANVMGLPLCHLAQMLIYFNVYPGTDLAQSCQEALSIVCSVQNRASNRKTMSDGR